MSEIKTETIRNYASMTLREGVSSTIVAEAKASAGVSYLGAYASVESSLKTSITAEIESQYKEETEKTTSSTKGITITVQRELSPEWNNKGFYKYILSADCDVYGLAVFDSATNDLIGIAYRVEYVPDTFGADVYFDPEDKTFGKNNDSSELVFDMSRLKGTITFDANGGSVEIKSKEYEYDKSAGELPIPMKPGFLFDGWYTSPANGSHVAQDKVMHEVGDITLYAHWRDNNLYRMERKSVARDSYYDSRTTEPSADIRNHHNNWELGELEVKGNSSSVFITGIRDEGGFVIYYNLKQNIDSIPNPRNVDIVEHRITDDSWVWGMRDYDCNSHVGKIGKGTYVVRVEYEDGVEEFVQTNFLADMNNGQSKQIFSSSQLDTSRQLNKIHVLVVYETLHTFHYGLPNIFTGHGLRWAEDFCNWICWYDFDF